MDQIKTSQNGVSLKTRENPLKRGIKHPSNWGIAIPQNRGTQKTLLQKKKEKIIRRLNTGKLQRDIYVLVLPEHGSNQLEIYNAALFLQPDFPNDDFFVVGIVRGYEAALELVEEIAGKVYEQTGAADIRTYLLEREQEG